MSDTLINAIHRARQERRSEYRALKPTQRSNRFVTHAVMEFFSGLEGRIIHEGDPIFFAGKPRDAAELARGYQVHYSASEQEIADAQTMLRAMDNRYHERSRQGGVQPVRHATKAGFGTFDLDHPHALHYLKTMHESVDGPVHVRVSSSEKNLEQHPLMAIARKQVAKQFGIPQQKTVYSESKGGWEPRTTLEFIGENTPASKYATVEKTLREISRYAQLPAIHRISPNSRPAKRQPLPYALVATAR